MRIAAVCFTLAVFALVPSTARAEPTVTVYTDADTYQSGDAIEVSLSVENLGEGTIVDAYVGLFMPDGSFLLIDQGGGLTGSIGPWLAGVYIPPSFEMASTPFFCFDVPDGVEGDFQFAAGLTVPGTLNFKSEISYAPFAIHGSGTGIRMLPIPAGSFFMGSPEGEEGRGEDEGPQHTVSISELMISETEITQKQWEDVMGWNHSVGELGDDLPIHIVTWFDCLSFCNRLS